MQHNQNFNNQQGYGHPGQFSNYPTQYAPRQQGGMEGYPNNVPSYQQALQQLQQQNQRPQTPVLKGKAVTGLDEAKASPIDFDGSIHFFTDIPNGYIYTKQIGLNGAAEFCSYKILPREIEKPQEQIESKCQGCSTASEERLEELQNKITTLENKLNTYEEALKNVKQHITTDVAASKQQQSSDDAPDASSTKSTASSSPKDGSIW